jgi:hypothetical protein
MLLAEKHAANAADLLLQWRNQSFSELDVLLEQIMSDVGCTSRQVLKF